MVKNIVILAAGPPKPNRNRHLELYNGEHIIDRVIEKCRIPNTKLFIVIDEENIDLRNHIKDSWNPGNTSNVIILIPKDRKIYSTFESALSVKGDCIMVCGDLINLQEGDIERFVNSKYKSATCQYRYSWGNHINSQNGNLLRRSDCGDCISMIAQNHKEEFLGSDNQVIYKWLYKQFHPNKIINDEVYNDVGTFMSYAFFKEIWSNPSCTNFGDKGTIYFEHKVYADND